MIGAIHHEIDACGYLAELADNEFVTDEIIVVRDMFFEILVTEITEIPNNDIGIFNGRFYIYERFDMRIRINMIWIWSVG